MLNDAKDLQAVYIVCGYTDLRKGIDSLSNFSNLWDGSFSAWNSVYVLWT